MDREHLRDLAGRHGAEARFGEPLSRHTSLRIGGEAAFYLRPSSWGGAVALVGALWEGRLPFRVLGGGTNLLVEDGPLPFGVVDLGHCSGTVRWEGERAEVDADVPLPALCAQACRMGLSGLEGMEGIPGTVGGGLVMNAGAFGCEMGKVVEEVAVVVPGAGLVRRPASEFTFGYRTSTVRGAGVVAGCSLRLEPSDPSAVRARAQEARARRQSSQPWRASTAGSVFKNPPGDFAGRVLESLGFKGRRLGAAGFSEQHANFLVNHGGATFAEALALCEEARLAAAGAGAELRYEVEIWRAEG